MSVNVVDHYEPQASPGIPTHGMSDTAIYGIWEAMKARCQNPANPKYADYGGRGIEVCQRWQHFVNFYADMGERPLGRTLDRVDNDGPYAPENCRWATVSEQNANRRPTVICKNGHLRDERTTLHTIDSARGADRIRCRACDAESRARYKARRRVLSEGVRLDEETGR